MLKLSRAGSISGSERADAGGAGTGAGGRASRRVSTASSVASRSHEDDQQRVVKVAIIGSGLTGLAAAYRLATASQRAEQAERKAQAKANAAAAARGGRSAATLRTPTRRDASNSGSSSSSSSLTPPVASSKRTSRAEGSKRRRLEIHIFEKAPHLGLDGNSISVKEPGGKTSLRVDVPMRSFNSGYYPEVLDLYKKLRIKTRKSDFTYSFASLNPSAASASMPRQGAPTPKMLYNGSSGVRGFGIPTQLASLIPGSNTLRSRKAAVSYLQSDLYAAVRGIKDYLSLLLLFTVSYLHLLFYAVFHHLLGHTRSPRHPLASRQLGEWTEAKGINPLFVSAIVVPLFSAVMTCQAESVYEAPVAEVLEYVACTFLRSHYTVLSGVHEVQRALSKPLPRENIHTGTQVVEIGDTDVGIGDESAGTLSVLVRDVEERSLALHDGFHHVIFATQANQTAAFLGKYLDRSSSAESSSRDAADTQRLRRMVRQMEAFRYEHSSVINHTDSTMMPPQRKDWRDLNLVTPVSEASKSEASAAMADDDMAASDSALSFSSVSAGPPASGHSQTQTMATHVIAQGFPSSNGPQLLMQTTNALPGMTPRPETVLSISNFHRAILTREGKAAQAGLYDWVPQAEVDAGLIWTAWARRAASLFAFGTEWTLRLGELQGGARQRKMTHEQIGRAGQESAQIWVCGSWSPGIPLLEGCARSARLVCEEILRQEGLQ